MRHQHSTEISFEANISTWNRNLKPLQDLSEWSGQLLLHKITVKGRGPTQKLENCITHRFRTNVDHQMVSSCWKAVCHLGQKLINNWSGRQQQISICADSAWRYFIWSSNANLPGDRTTSTSMMTGQVLRHLSRQKRPEHETSCTEGWNEERSVSLRSWVWSVMFFSFKYRKGLLQCRWTTLMKPWRLHCRGVPDSVPLHLSGSERSLCSHRAGSFPGSSGADFPGPQLLTVSSASFLGRGIFKCSVGKVLNCVSCFLI